MLVISKFLVAGPIEMQSSPVLKVAPVIVTPVEPWTWMPSVKGLWSGAITLIFRTTTLLQNEFADCLLMLTHY